MSKYKKQTEKYLEESGRLFKALRLSNKELNKLVEEGPCKKRLPCKEYMIQ